jgi:hypothetical protein
MNTGLSIRRLFNLSTRITRDAGWSDWRRAHQTTAATATEDLTITN